MQLNIKSFYLKCIDVFCLLILIGVIIGSYRRPNIPWDSWAYHLPFSALIFDINNARANFILSDDFLPRFNGFPLFADWLQGLLWKFTGNVKSTVLISSVGLAGFILFANRFFKCNLSILVLGLLTIPQISLHVLATYSDLFFGVLVSLQFISAIAIQQFYMRGSYPVSQKIGWALLFLIAGAIGGNTKMWGPFLCIAISFFMLIYVAIEAKSIKKIKYLILLCAVTSILSCSTLIKNYQNFANPFYPITVNIPLLNIELAGPEDDHSTNPGFAKSFGPLAQPIYFFTSITEIDWLIRGINFYYSFDSEPGGNPKRFDKARAGGWWGPFIILNILLLIYIYKSLNSKLKSSNANESNNNFSFYLFVFITIFISFIPQSHSLRYFFFWPICLIFLNSLYIKRTPLWSRFSAIVVSIYLILFLYSIFGLRGEQFRDEPFNKNSIKLLLKNKTQDEIVNVPEDFPQLKQAKELGGICLGPDYTPNQIRWSAIFHQNTYVLEQGNSECKYLPAFTK